MLKEQAKQISQLKLVILMINKKMKKMEVSCNKKYNYLETALHTHDERNMET